MLLLIFAAAIGLLFYSTFSWGYVSYMFYGWFIHPIFPTLPDFTYIQFAGFLLFLHVLLPKHTHVVKQEYRDQENEWIVILLTPWLSLFFGWLFRVFIL